MTVAMRPEVPLRVITPADVRASIGRARRSLEKAAEEICWQIEMEAWRTLGYSSWTAMREAEYGGAAFMVPSKSRPEIVARIRAAGLTQKEVAETAGVTERTVRNDLSTGNFSGSDATITNSRGQSRPATYTRTDTPDDDVIDAEIVEEPRSNVIECSDCCHDFDPAVITELDTETLLCPPCLDKATGETTTSSATAQEETDPTPVESATHRTCPTCHGTGEITA